MIKPKYHAKLRHKNLNNSFLQKTTHVQTELNTKKLKPDLSAFQAIQPGNRQGLFYSSGDKKGSKVF